MKTVRLPIRLAVLASLCLTLGLGLQAQPAAPATSGSGRITGRVQNAVTGDNLENARVSVKGTNIVAFTDDGGVYHLDNLPAGAIALRVFFTGLDEKEVVVNVPAGASAEQDIGMTSKARYGDASESVKLDRFVVESTKETNAGAIAVNEQRFSPNQKSVVSADQFGIIPDTNPGELMKWLPGVSVEYFANTIIGVSVRGLDSANTEINFDGMPVASTTSTSSNLGRGFEMRAASASDIARVEVRKLPLPENSSNTLGGTINLIRRSAFEYTKRKIEYNALFTTEAESFTLGERDGPKDRTLQYWRPNLQVKWTEPISKNFGFAFTVGHDDKITRVHWSFPTWNFGGNAQVVSEEEARIAAGLPLNRPSVYNPVKTTQGLHDNPIWNYKDYVTLKVDWRPRDELKLSYAVNAGLFQNQSADDLRFLWNTGTFATVASTTALGQPGTNNQYNAYGSTGVGGIGFDTREGWRDEYNPTITNSGEVEWRNKGGWTFNARGTLSISKHTLYDTDHGFFNNMTGTGITQTGIGSGFANARKITVNFLDQTKYMPRTIEARDGDATSPTFGQLIDWSDPKNMYIGGAASRQGASKEIITASRLYAERGFNYHGNPIKLKFGFDYDDQYRSRSRYDTQLWNFVGPDGVKGTADDSADQIAAVNIKAVRDEIYDAPPVPRLSMSRLYKLYQDHPSWFQYNDAESYRGAVSTPFKLHEQTYAGYVQFTGSIAESRLGYAGGVRYERADATGYGLLDRGTKILPAGVSSTSLQGYQLRLIRNGAHASGSHDGYFPSLHLNYNLTSNLKFMIGYAKTQAKNRFDRTVIPATSVSDTAVTSGPFSGLAIGTLSLRNPDLEPWVGHNYEAHLEYYTPQGGLIGVGAFRKNIHNWQSTGFAYLDTPATAAEWGFDPGFVGYQVSTLFNDGNARIDGAEAEIRQPLDTYLPAWAKGFQIFGSFNYNDLKGRGNNIGGDFGTLYQTQTKFSLSYQNRRFKGNVGIINYGKIFRQQEDFTAGAVTGTGTSANPQFPAKTFYGSRYYPPFNTIDFNLDFSLGKWSHGARLFVSGQNFTGARKMRERVIDAAPDWSRMQIENNLGKTYTVGVTGSF
jgi:iron complex outermembrane receptor protein